MDTHQPLYIDIHALQTVPPNNMNRDDTGSPKTAIFGGVLRQRVSSQAWKKAIRDEFLDLLDPQEVGLRTVQVASLVRDKMQEIAPGIDAEAALKKAWIVLKQAGIKPASKNPDRSEYLLFVSRRQVEKLAQLAIQVEEKDQDKEEKAPDKKAVKEILDVKASPALNAIDIALFGRMIADAPEFNVDAAVQVAHALGVGRAIPEFDYFTALDDLQPEDNTGAEMINTTEFLSSTLYRYASVDVYHLYKNLGSIEVTAKAVEAFLKAFVIAMPTGKQNSFANRTLPSVVMVQLRNTQPISLVNAFEVPVEPYDGKGSIELACKKLAAEEESLDQAFGVTPEKTYVIGAGSATMTADSLWSGDTAEITSLKEVISCIDQDVSSYLANVSEE